MVTIWEPSWHPEQYIDKRFIIILTDIKKKFHVRERDQEGKKCLCVIMVVEEALGAKIGPKLRIIQRDDDLECRKPPIDTDSRTL